MKKNNNTAIPFFHPFSAVSIAFGMALHNSGSPLSCIPCLTCVFSLLPQAMVETVNNLLQPRAQAAWRELPTSEQQHSATLLLDTVETGAFMLADNLLKTDTVQEITDNIRKFCEFFFVVVHFVFLVPSNSAGPVNCLMLFALKKGT